MMAEFLRATKITKAFPGVLANDHISLEVREGEVHALLGENGAGKTVFTSILYGLYQPDFGEIYVHGERFRMSSPRRAMACGIGMVQQNFMLIPVFTVAQNIVLGVDPFKKWYRPGEGSRREVQRLADEYGFEIDPDAKVEDLSVGIRQRVEILKVLYRRARLLILDEPTGVLTPQEAHQLSVSLRRLVDQGLSVIFITHKLHEVMEFSDRVTVMRSGRVVDSCKTADTDEMSLARMMVGRDVVLRVSRPEQTPGAVALKVDGLRVMNAQGVLALRDISFELREGEIMGVAGVDGNGQRELAEALYGLRRPISGKIRLLGKDVTGFPVSHLQQAGLRYVAPDRVSALIRSFTVTENLVLEDVARPAFSRRGIVKWDQAAKFAESMVKEFSVHTSSVRNLAKNLSGGNQQKILLARATWTRAKVLIVAQPTRGLDVGATEYIRLKLLECRSTGMAVLLISTDLDEILSLSDRIAVLFRGQWQGILDHSEAGRERVGALMAGGNMARQVGA